MFLLSRDIFRPWLLRGATLTLIFAYGLPKLAEFEMLRHMISPVLCVLVGDLVGCAAIFALGFRRTAIAVYLLATTCEAFLLFFHILEARWVMLAADTLPTLILFLIMMYALSYRRIPDE